MVGTLPGGDFIKPAHNICIVKTSNLFTTGKNGCQRLATVDNIETCEFEFIRRLIKGHAITKCGYAVVIEKKFIGIAINGLFNPFIDAVVQAQRLPDIFFK